MEEIWTEINWRPDETSRAWKVRLGWEVIGGRWEAVALEVSPSGHAPLAPLRAVDVKALRLGEIVELSRPQLLDEIHHDLAIASGLVRMQEWRRTMVDNPWSDAEREENLALLAEHEPLVREATKLREELEAVSPPKAKPGRPPLYDSEHFARVATIYRDTYASGGHPTRAVAEHFHVQRSTAAKWIARCRTPLGLLGHTDKRKAGGLPPENSE